MARLHEHQGKAILKERGIAVPPGVVVTDAKAARAAAGRIDGSAVLKVQAWTTGRAAKGGVRFADSPDEAAALAEEMLDLSFGNFPVTELLVEQAIEIEHELFVSITVDDAARAPVLLLDWRGGSGIEDRASAVHRLPVDVRAGVTPAAITRALAESPIESALQPALVETIAALVEIARELDARSLEINPLAITTDGGIVALDCRIAIDDYAVFRHPELGIEIARELDHPPTELEKLAYRIEEADHRGTFYFAELPTDDELPLPPGEGRGEGSSSRGLIGFHGAGGGGSMMSMDAVTDAGFTLANFCDTSGNPSAAKVCRAARIILSQPGLVGYFGSGSGVASQEQFWSAYGLAKAFIEMRLAIPAVIRLGGNGEDRAVEILEDACRDLPAPVEGYKKDDTPVWCAARFAQLVEQHPSPSGRGEGGEGDPQSGFGTRRAPAFVGRDAAYSFPITGGRVWIDDGCDEETAQLVVNHSDGLLRMGENRKPRLAVSAEEIAGKDSELIACEIECHRAGRPVVFVDLLPP